MTRGKGNPRKYYKFSKYLGTYNVRLNEVSPLKPRINNILSES